MNKRMSLIGLGVVMAFLSLAVFTACKEDDSITIPTSQIQITGIPATVLSRPSYKIYVQLSAGMDASAGYVAKGEARINGATSVTMDLKNSAGQLCSVTGPINMAVVISPETVHAWNSSSPQIEVYANQKILSANPQSFVWGSAGGFVHLNEIMLEQVHQIFDGATSGKPGIVWHDPEIGHTS
ncbi:hypothetical protein AGMMS50268_05290 [Spirochaetia bacterium]|nr:hypothetical protein AGMMS50268_05290 [Spirochaetia bacterium]